MIQSILESFPTKAVPLWEVPVRTPDRPTIADVAALAGVGTGSGAGVAAGGGGSTAGVAGAGGAVFACFSAFHASVASALLNDGPLGLVGLACGVDCNS